MIPKAQMQTVDDKTVISGLRWYASDWYGLLITVVGDFSQTEIKTWNGTNNIGPCLLGMPCLDTDNIIYEWQMDSYCFINFMGKKLGHKNKRYPYLHGVRLVLQAGLHLSDH